MLYVRHIAQNKRKYGGFYFMLFYQWILSLNKKLHVFDFAYKTCGFNWDYEPVVSTHHIYVIANNKKDALEKAQAIARIRAKKAFEPEEYKPVFRRRVHIKEAVDKMLSLYVADNVINKWPCNVFAHKAAIMRGELY
jgi:hypothetical protein